MNQKLLKNVWLRVGMIVAVVTTAFAGTAQAEIVEDVYKSVNFGTCTYSSQVNNYTTTGVTATDNGFTVTLDYFNTAVSGYVGCGGVGQSSMNTPTISSATIDKKITKVSLEIQGIEINNPNGEILQVQLYDGDFYETIGTYKLTVNSPVTVEIPEAKQAEGLSYVFSFPSIANYATGTPAVKISKVNFYRKHDPNQVEDPIISGTTPFDPSTSVTITCPTSGATILYSTNDGATWTTGSSLTLDKTTTVKAKATKDGMTESGVVSKSFICSAGSRTSTLSLTTTTYSGTPTASLATWNFLDEAGPTAASMSVEKGNGQYAVDVNVTNPDATNGTQITSLQHLKFEPKEGYAIVSVEIKGSSESNLSPLNKKWSNATCSASGTTLTITPEDGTKLISVTVSYNNTVKITEVTVRYTPTASYAYAKIGSAEYATFVPAYSVSVPEGLTAYIVTGFDDSVVMEKITTIPAGTPVVLNGSEGTYDLPIITGASAVTGNLLQVRDEAFYPSKRFTIYCLSQVNGKVAFYPLPTTRQVPAGKPYLEDTSNSAKAFYGFDEDATGIEAIENAIENGAIYNVAGQRLSKMQKGINIVNGKKILK